MSSDARVLLLDVNSGSGMRSRLRKILESSHNACIELREHIGDICDFSFLDGPLTEIMVNFDPHVIFMCLNPAHLEHSAAFSRYLAGNSGDMRIIAVIEEVRPDEMVEFMKCGIKDFITPPLKSLDILTRMWRLLEQKRSEESIMQRLKEKIGLKQLVGRGRSFLDVIEKIPLVAKCDTSVMLSGDTGTGKELCARSIHYLSPRGRKPFVPVNCGAIPVELMENELFGHVEGAFTGARKPYPGLVSQADGGTLFLDEVDCLALSAQVKLLRFLQEKEYRQLGSSQVRQVDVRIIAASNLDLGKAVEEGKFRRDLFYRLNIIPLTLPPLRERKEDIPLLARHFLAKYCAELKKQIADFTADAIRKLMLYDWPGNVRELENVVERAVVFSEHGIIQGADIILPESDATVLDESFQAAKARVVTEFEKSYIHSLLHAYKGNITRSAQVARKNRRAFWELIRKHDIDVERYRPGYL